MTSPDKKSLHSTQNKLDRLETEHNRVLRELRHWRLLARLRDERLQQIETNRAWRMVTLIQRICAYLKMHWKLIPFFTLLAIVALPFMPLVALVAILLIPKKGRAIAHSIVAKKPVLREAIGTISHKARTLWEWHPIGSEEADPIIYRRTQRYIPPPLNPGDADLHNLLHQLSPQHRQVLQRFHLTEGPLIDTTEIPSYQSLSQSEITLLRLCTAEAGKKAASLSRGARQ